MAVSVKAVLVDQMQKGNMERLIKRLASHLVKRGLCWIWTGSLTKDGYPRMNFIYRGKHTQVYVHHVFFVLRTGEDISEGMELDHRCQAASCVWCVRRK